MNAASIGVAQSRYAVLKIPQQESPQGPCSSQLRPTVRILGIFEREWQICVCVSLPSYGPHDKLCPSTPFCPHEWTVTRLSIPTGSVSCLLIQLLCSAARHPKSSSGE